MYVESKEHSLWQKTGSADAKKFSQLGLVSIKVQLSVSITYNLKKKNSPLSFEGLLIFKSHQTIFSLLETSESQGILTKDVLMRLVKVGQQIHENSEKFFF